MKKNIIKKLTVYALLIILLAALQLNYPGNFEFFGMVPDLLFVLTILTAYFKGLDDGVAVGFFAGMIKNMFSGRFLGLGVLIMMYAAVASALFLRKHLRTGVPAAMLQVIMLSAAYSIMTGIAIYALDGTVFAFDRFTYWWTINRFLPGVAVNAVAAVFLAFIIKLLPSAGGDQDEDNVYVRPMEII